MAHLSIDQVELFASGELSEAELQPVNKHIESCAECEQWIQVEVAQSAAIRSWTSAKIRNIQNASKTRAK